MSEPRSAPLMWTGSLFDRGGFATESRDIILGLDEAGYSVIANPLGWGAWTTPFRDDAAERLQWLIPVFPPDEFVHVYHGPTRLFGQAARGMATVGRTMFETDAIPREWIRQCQEVDEIWVPSQFCVDTYTASGMPPSRIRRVGECLDLDTYDRDIESVVIPGAEGFIFLSVFGFGIRKGWDVLLTAYLNEFRRSEDVTLVLKMMPSFSLTIADHVREIRKFIDDSLGIDMDRAPSVVIYDEFDPGPAGMPSLYKAADAFVVPTRGEGFGRTFAEAMAMGLPTIGTGWSGHLDFMDSENSYLIDYELVPTTSLAVREHTGFRGLRWAEPSVDHLRSLMRHVFEHPDEARARGVRARATVFEKCSRTTVTEQIVAACADLGAPIARRVEPPRVGVRWEGPIDGLHSMAQVNRNVLRALVGSRRADLEIVCHPPAGESWPAEVVAEPRPDALEACVVTRESTDPSFDELAGESERLTVRHSWPPNLRPPAAGPWVLYQPWEFGALPSEWVDLMNRAIDEIWVPTSWVRDDFVRSGVDGTRIAVVPYGVDPTEFSLVGPRLKFRTRARFRFLFVGGTLARKGIDLLLDAYCRAFTPEDDVCLIVKDVGPQSFYAGQNHREQIQRLAADPSLPEILYLDDELPSRAMPALYRGCHALVHPYRGEGFALPVAEAMACGLAVIVPDTGACRDYCDATNSFLVPCREVVGAAAYVGEYATVAPPWFHEVEVPALALAMREVAQDRDGAQRVGERGRQRIHALFGWKAAALVALERVDALSEEVPRRLAEPAPTPSTPSAPVRAQPGLLDALEVLVMARDEELLLPRALASVAAITRHVTVMDTGSRDRTVSLATEAGTRVAHYPWHDDFAAARTHLLRIATRPWVLVLDADQYVDRASRAVIAEILRHAPKIYSVIERNYLDERGSGTVVEHRVFRLFPSHDELCYRGAVHEQLVGTNGQFPFDIAHADVVLHHDGLRDGGVDPNKVERDLRALGVAAREAPNDPFVFFNLGVTLVAKRDWPGAYAAFSRCVKLGASAPVVADYHVSALVALSNVLTELGRPADALAVVERALRINPSSDAEFARGRILTLLGRFDEAIRAFDAARRFAHQPVGTLTDRATSGWKALAGTGEAHLLAGRASEGARFLRAALDYVPDDPSVLGPLARAGYAAGDASGAEVLLHRAMQSPKSDRRIWLLLADLYARTDRGAEAEELIAEARLRFGA